MNNCNKTSNNKYFDCPARMDDGRTFTDYRSSSQVDDMIRYSNNVMSSYEYRQFLINNADNIMNINNQYIFDKVGCESCNSEKVPFKTKCDINSDFSVCSNINYNCIGIYNIVSYLENFSEKTNTNTKTNTKKDKNGFLEYNQPDPFTRYNTYNQSDSK